MDVTVVIGTFGSPEWIKLAEARAIPSVRSLGMPVVHCHEDTLHEARNAGVAQVDTEWVVHLDADDELEAGYVAAMATGTADLRAPAVRYIDHRGRAAMPGMPAVAGHRHSCTAACLTAGNWLIVGAAVRTDLVRQVGGWRDWLVYEDWDLWLRCHLAGASIQAIPQAIYRAHVRPNSRNRAPAVRDKNRVHHDIIRSIFPTGVPA